MGIMGPSDLLGPFVLGIIPDSLFEELFELITEKQSANEEE